MSNPQVELHIKDYGVITLELDADKAPKSTENFLNYVKSGHYDGTIFHRVINNFMIQGGGFVVGMEQKPTRAPIINESTNGLQNLKGSIAMARTSDPDSATAQFFINLVDNANLNGNPGKPGYAVFGKVIHGMDIVEKIAVMQTGERGMHQDVPLQDVVIISAKRLP